MKRLGVLLFAALILSVTAFSACGGAREIRFLTPDGGTLLPVAQIFYDAPECGGLSVSGEIVSGVAIESRLFAGTCEAAIAPVNLCAKVFEANGSYLFAGVVAWGNNYILSTSGSQPESLSELRGEVLYAWGAEAVPGKTLKTVLDRHGVAYETVTAPEQATGSDKVYLLFMADAGSIVSEIKKGSKVRYAMLPEPNVTAMTAGVTSPTIAFDLQKLWNPEDSSANYPQAGLMIKKEFAGQNPAAVSELLGKIKQSAEYCLANPSETAALAKDELQSVALPPAAVIVNYIKGRGQTVMRYKSVSDAGVKESVSEYLQAIMGTAPDEGFFL